MELFVQVFMLIWLGMVVLIGGDMALATLWAFSSVSVSLGREQTPVIGLVKKVTIAMIAWIAFWSG